MAKKGYSKYRVPQDKKSKEKRTVFDEHTGKKVTFASNIEKKYYDEVVLNKYKTGEIVDYDLQKKYTLQKSFRRNNGDLVRAIEYIADYYLVFADGHIEVKDTKGCGELVDSVAKIKAKLLYCVCPELDFEWITWSKDTGWINWNEAMKIRRTKKKEKKSKGE